MIHQVSYFGDFQIYRKGEWALTHPISYSGPALKGEGTNAMVIGSFSSMAEFKRIKAQEQAADNSYTYISGTTGGQKAPEGSYDPPPTFLSEWTRSLVYLPSRDAHSDTIVVFDRTNALNPRALPKFTRYRTRSPDEQTAILEMPAMKQWIIQSPVEPTLAPGGLSWSTPGGQSVAVDTLLPSAQRRLVYNETELWTETAVRAAERKWQTRIVPAVEQAWDTFLNVVQVFDSGTGRSNVLVRSTNGDAEGALVRRAGHSDTLLVFNATPGPTLSSVSIGPILTFDAATEQTLSRVGIRGTAYDLRWTSTTPQTDLLLFDLAPGAWQVVVDGNSASVSVSDQGVGRLAVPGAGEHSIQVKPAR